jgi:hypothetical protein
MNVKDIHVIRSQPLQTLLDPQHHTLARIPTRIHILGLAVPPTRVFGGNDQLISIPTKFHPFSDPEFGFTEMVEVGGIDEITTGGDERIEEFESG